MRRLIIECASEACSLALFDDDALVANRHEILGRGHAERLVPAIGELPQAGRADSIAVSCGPGSFTGTRIGIAAARALGLAWKVPVRGFSTLALLAGSARDYRDTADLGVVMNGGHGEWIVQTFDADGRPKADFASVVPEEAVAGMKAQKIVGNLAEEFVDRRGFGTALHRLPDATSFPSMPNDLLTDEVTALYARPPDARPPSR